MGAKVPGVGLLAQEEGCGDDMPHLAKWQAISALPPSPAIIELQNGTWRGVGARRRSSWSGETEEGVDHWLGLPMRPLAGSETVPDSFPPECPRIP